MAKNGTNFFEYGLAVNPALTDEFGNIILVKGTVANLPSGAAGYAVGCEYIATDTGNHYYNEGTTSSCSFTIVDLGTAFGLPDVVTDSTTTTTISFSIVQDTVTTGSGITQSLDGLTTGTGHLIDHTTSVIADGGSLLRLSSSSIDTGGATNGTLLDLKSTGQLAGTTARLDVILTTGTAMSIISSGIMTTTGNLLTLTANSATTAAGLLRINANGLTSGIGAVISSSATAITGAGRLLRVDHTGATGSSAILSEFASAANDETVILKATASAALAGGVLAQLSGAAVTTGTLLDISDNTAHTTGYGIKLLTNSADTGTRSLMYIKQDHASASGATPLEILNDGALALIKGTATATSTHFYPFAKINGVTIWMGDGTTANGALSGTAGDLLINGGSNKPEYCTGTTNWTALV